MKLVFQWLSAFVWVAALALPAFAGESKGDGAAQADIDARTGKRMNEALEALNADKYNEAKAILGELDRTRLSPYELGRVEQILASIASAQQDYGAAQRHLQAAIQSGGMSVIEVDQARYQIAQLFMAQEKWREGRDALQQWLNTTQSKPNAQAYYLLAAANYQLEDLAAALPPAKKAVEMSENPQKSWVEMLLALYLGQQMYGEAAPLLKQLITKEPDRATYWEQLSSVYRAEERYNEALAVMEVSRLAGHVRDESDQRTLSDLAVFSGIPHRGARHLERAMASGGVPKDSKNYERLAQAWTAAREYDKSIQPLQRAAESAGNGELFVRLAQINVQREDWKGATAALEKAIAKGGLRDVGAAQLLMGIALYSQEKNGEAKTWFERAAKSSSSRSQAESWLRAVSQDEST